VALCAGALIGTTVALYLELPIRAAMDAPLVYGHPDTWDGFWYVVLGEQFRGDLVNPFGDFGRKAADLAKIAGDQLGILAVAVPAAFLLTAMRRPRFALLTGTWLAVICWFAASYTNGAIDRYYLGPALIVIAWLGVAAGLLVEALLPAAGDEAGADWTAGPDPGVPPMPTAGRARLGARVLAAVLAVALVLPAALAAPATAGDVDMSHDTRARDWSRWALGTVGADAVVISWWSFSTPLWYRTVVLGERPDAWVIDDRDRLDEDLGSVDDVIRANIALRPVYLVRRSAEISALEAAWILEIIPDPRGIQPLYRVVGPRPAAGRALPSGAHRRPPGGPGARPATMTP